MQPTLLPSLRELFDACIDLSADARSPFLDEHCPDVSLRSEVEDLLRADASAPGLFAGGAQAAADAIGEGNTDTTLPAGSRIGPFEIIGVLGEGGSSTVFRARRESVGVHQDVALKILHRGLYTKEAQRQFRRERQALAQLSHAGIARLIEGGVTDSGLAYIALELIEGQPITDFARDRKLRLRERLILFLQVCRAVEAAHHALIVHRDIKPSNVFVTADGQVKLLDFGIAKLLDVDDETQTRQPMLTPGYAAPEQQTGGAVTTATDAHALGVLLGELVTGRRLRGGDGRTPSSQVEVDAAPGVLPDAPLTTRRLLRGDLDNIIGKAIDPRPERRYASAGVFADDIERLLDGRPVAAHPPSPWYRARKFMTRHRGAAVGSLVFLLGILGALGIALWQARAARQQALRAEHEAARANAANDFLASIFAASNPIHAQGKPRGEITARELLDLNAGRIAERFPDDPQTRISLLGVVASAYRELGEDEKYKKLHGQQLDLARAVDGESSPLLIEGMIDEAQLATRRRDYAAAAAILAKTDPLIEQAQLDESWLRAYWWLARGLSLQGDVAARQERTQALQKAVALYARFGPMHSGYAEGLYTLGSDSINEPAVAEKYFREAIARSEAMPERDDAGLQVFYAALALAQQNRADYDGAEATYAKAADLARHSTGEQDFHYWIPEAMHAHMVHRLGDRARADAMFARLVGLLPAQAEDQQADGVASVQQHWAETLIAEGRPREAVAPLLQTLERRRAKRARMYDVPMTRAALGDAYDRVGRTDDARSELDAATKEWIEKFPADSYFVLQARERWGRFLLDRGDEGAAAEQFREVLAQAKDRHFAPIAFAHGGLARIALAHGDVPTALTEVRVAIETFDHPTGLRDVRGGPYLWLIESAALLRSGDAAGAREKAQRALDASRRYDDPAAQSIADAQAALRAAQG